MFQKFGGEKNASGLLQSVTDHTWICVYNSTTRLRQAALPPPSIGKSPTLYAVTGESAIIGLNQLLHLSPSCRVRWSRPLSTMLRQRIGVLHMAVQVQVLRGRYERLRRNHDSNLHNHYT